MKILVDVIVWLVFASGLFVFNGALGVLALARRSDSEKSNEKQY